ncbi:hypothetical protein B0J12DRAFT_765001 [Macrophomina phaseolina]|uniref:Uncharacterized protein n=1 Tax=Macrophomina phaseolina TaxID=35725 RepID=A0ABQ8G2E2_9PEZI|nr:hypothetical protein B0J12DRAFT_765001 [Macrophomina phaseolina]
MALLLWVWQRCDAMRCDVLPRSEHESSERSGQRGGVTLTMPMSACSCACSGRNAASAHQATRQLGPRPIGPYAHAASTFKRVHVAGVRHRPVGCPNAPATKLQLACRDPLSSRLRPARPQPAAHALSASCCCAPAGNAITASQLDAIWEGASTLPATPAAMTTMTTTTSSSSSSSSSAPTPSAAIGAAADGARGALARPLACAVAGRWLAPCLLPALR